MCSFRVGTVGSVLATGKLHRRARNRGRPLAPGLDHRSGGCCRRGRHSGNHPASTAAHSGTGARRGASILGDRLTATTWLRAPFISRSHGASVTSALIATVVGALVVGTTLVGYNWITTEVALLTLVSGTSLSPVTAILYGGITEEVLIRWGDVPSRVARNEGHPTTARRTSSYVDHRFGNGGISHRLHAAAPTGSPHAG